VRRKKAGKAARLFIVIGTVTALMTGVVPLPSSFDQADPANAQGANAQGATISRVSLTSSGQQGTGGFDYGIIPDSHTNSVSADGTKIAFESKLAGLVPEDSSNNYDVFVKDTTTGEIELVSVATDGSPAGGSSYSPTISADGNKVAFVSSGSDLVPGDTNAKLDVFVRNLESGVTNLVSVAADGGPANDHSDTREAMISADGTKVAFGSHASNLVAGDTNQAPDVFLRNLQTGATAPVSVNAAGQWGNGEYPSVSANGRWVAFATNSSKLRPGLVAKYSVVRKDMQTGEVFWVSHPLSGNSEAGQSHKAAISADGQHVAFVSYSSNLVEGDEPCNVVLRECWDVFLWDAATNTTVKVTKPHNGEVAEGDTFGAPSVSEDGRYVAFASDSADLVPDDYNGVEDVFVRDMATSTTTRVSTPLSGVAGTPRRSASAWISPNGRFISFESLASNLVEDDTNFKADVFLQWDPSRITNDKFVYVALGDSYSSGEGAGHHMASLETIEQYKSAYEAGMYDERFIADGNNCHRALANYARLSADLLEPGKDVEVIDQTCSGAVISGNNNYQEQIGEVEAELEVLGLTGDDVDLVTMGFGGNDAKFAELAAACLAPHLLRELVKKYPGSTPSTVNHIAKASNCWLLDNILVHSKDAIDDLQSKQATLHAGILGKFSNAEVLQVTDPLVVPRKVDAQAVCSGIRNFDLTHARRRAKQINEAVEAAVASNPRVGLVQLEAALGSNPLCPEDPEDLLMVAASRDNIDRVVTSLLEESSESRRRLDAFFEAARQYEACGRKLPGFLQFPFCQHFLDDALDAFNSLQSYVAGDGDGDGERDALGLDVDGLKGDLVMPPPYHESGYPLGFRQDVGRGFLHPNQAGWAAFRCHLLKRYRNYGSCPQQPAGSGPIELAYKGQPAGTTPLDTQAGSTAELTAAGFAPNSTALLTLRSNPISLGSATADASGVVRTTLTMPEAPAGVHTIIIEGETAGGVAVTQEIRVRYPGRPVGGDGYSTYLCCFESITDDNDPEELVEMNYGGVDYGAIRPEDDGGVLISVPVIDPLDWRQDIPITLTSQLTGKVLTESINPIPSVAALWATIQGPGALEITGVGTKATGLVHSDGSLSIVGSDMQFTAGVEYGANLTTELLGTNTLDPAPRQVEPGGSPITRQIEAFRPGSQIAQKAGSNYRAINAFSCLGGVWTPSPGAVPSGIVYVPCGVNLTAVGSQINATIAAEGKITITGAGITVQPSIEDMPSLVTAATGADAVVVLGANVELGGTVFAPQGTVRAAGLGGTYRCGVVAARIAVVEANNSFLVDDGCRLEL